MYSHESRKAAGGATSKIDEEDDAANTIKAQKPAKKEAEKKKE